MARDKFNRSKLFEVESGGLTLVECDRVTGLRCERGTIIIVDAAGNEVPLSGGFKAVKLEFHDIGPNNTTFLDWFFSDDPERKSGAVHVKNQAKVIQDSVNFSDMIPDLYGWDDLDRKNEDVHGKSYGVTCMMRA